MRWMIDLVDRLLHSRRRRRAIQLLREPLRPGTILFVCYGNICRSPFAEALFRRDFKPDPHGVALTSIRSAGFTGADRAPPPEAVAAAAKLRVDIASHRSTVITPDVYRAATVVVTMSADQARELQARFGRRGETVIVLADLDPRPIRSRTIRDPWRGPPEGYDESYSRIRRCVLELIKALDGA